MKKNINERIKEELSVTINDNLKGSDLRALDIGFGTGILSYQLIHCHNFKNVFGLDKMAKLDIVDDKNQSSFFQATIGNKFLKRKEVEEEFDDNRGIDYYWFYKVYVEKELNQKPFSEDEFEIFLNSNVCFGKQIKDYSWAKTYDLIILSRVLHYMESSEQKDAIKRALDNLNDNGVLFIVNRPDVKKGNLLDGIIKEFNLQNIKIDFFEVSPEEKYDFYVLKK